MKPQTTHFNPLYYLAEAERCYLEALNRLNKVLPTGCDAEPAREQLQKVFSNLYIATNLNKNIVGETRSALIRLRNIREILETTTVRTDDKLGLITREVTRATVKQPKWKLIHAS